MIKKPLVCAILATFAMPAVADNTKLGEELTTTLKGVLVSSQTNQNTGFDLMIQNNPVILHFQKIN